VSACAGCGTGGIGAVTFGGSRRVKVGAPAGGAAWPLWPGAGAAFGRAPPGGGGGDALPAGGGGGAILAGGGAVGVGGAAGALGAAGGGGGGGAAAGGGGTGFGAVGGGGGAGLGAAGGGGGGAFGASFGSGVPLGGCCGAPFCGGCAPFGGCFFLASSFSFSVCATAVGADCARDAMATNCIAVSVVVASSTRRSFLMAIWVLGVMYRRARRSTNRRWAGLWRHSEPVCIYFAMRNAWAELYSWCIQLTVQSCRRNVLLRVLPACA